MAEPTLHLDRFTDEDRRMAVEMLDFLVTHDYATEEELTLTERGFTLKVRVVGAGKPGVAAMRHLAATYQESPLKLMQVLGKLLHATTAERVAELKGALDG